MTMIIGEKGIKLGNIKLYFFLFIHDFNEVFSQHYIGGDPR